MRSNTCLVYFSIVTCVMFHLNGKLFCEQWMTAGRGIVHCEMPFGDGVSHGLQLWVNLAMDKMVEPAYQELLNKDIPRVERDGVKIRVIAGEYMGTKVFITC